MTEDRKAPKLPVEGKRNVLITSALPYVNNVPHLGNIIACVLSADVFARYCRLRGYNAIYICGTDDYGTVAETKALEDCSPKEICDKYHAIHKEVYDWFNISFDEFGRTSSPEQTEVCQAIFKKVHENNWLSEDTSQQLYCDTCKRFLADRLVEGTCPNPTCEYDSARGDQCENCAKLLNPTELKIPKCKVCRNSPRICDRDHLFLELPLLEDKVQKYINETSVVGSWSQNAIQTTNSLVRMGLKKHCITRDLKSGVPVPHENYSDKVSSAWFDALIGYISITASYTRDWEKWWKNPENVELFQFMGKDNVPFHTVMFPSTLLGTGQNWTLMKTISVTEYLNDEAGKFSKSKGIGVFGNDAKDTNIPVEVWRYYLLTNRPEESDTLFTWSDLQEKINTELLDNLGKFVHRVLSFIAKPAGYDSIIPAVHDDESGDSHDPTKKFANKVAAYMEKYIESMEKVKLKQGLEIAMSISGEGNAYLQETEFWHLSKQNQSLSSLVIKTAAGIVYLLACLLEPFMPSFSLEVFKQLNLSVDTHLSLCDDKGGVDRVKRPWDLLSAGHKIGTPKPLFMKLKNEEVEIFRKKFEGTQADRIVREEQSKKTKVSDANEKKKSAAKASSSGTKNKASTDMETDEETSLNDYRAAFRKVIEESNLILKDPRHSNDSLYEEGEFPACPSEGFTTQTFSKWSINFKRNGSALTLLISPTEINKNTILGWIVVAAVHNTEPSKRLYFSHNYPSDVLFKHTNVFQAGNGFMDDEGFIKIMFQIQYIPDKPTSIHLFHRTFLLELYWIGKDRIDEAFSEVLKTARETFIEYKKKPLWKSFLEHVKNSEKFSMREDMVWKHLRKHCEEDHLLAAILKSGSEQLLNPQKEFTILLRGANGEFGLEGGVIDLGHVLHQASQMSCSPIKQLDPGSFHLNGVQDFEMNLLKNCCTVFQNFLLTIKVKEGYNDYDLMKEEPGIGSKEGKGGGKHIQENITPHCDLNPDVNPDDGESPNNTKKAELHKSLELVDTLYKECISPVLTYGCKFRKEMKEISRKHPLLDEFRSELKVAISNKHREASSEAFYQFQEVQERKKNVDLIQERESEWKRIDSIAHRRMQKIEEEAHKIGVMGERYALEYYSKKFKDGYKVDWVNKDEESFHPFDLRVYDNEPKEPVLYIEVKSTSKKHKNWFFLSRGEYEHALLEREKYMIAHIHIDEKEQDETKKYSVIEYVDPASERCGLQLCMTRLVG